MENNSQACCNKLPTHQLLTTMAGVLELEKQRPVEVLQAILEERSAQQLEAFFRAYGAPEVAAMCLLLITHPSATLHVVRAPVLNLAPVPQGRHPPT